MVSGSIQSGIGNPCKRLWVFSTAVISIPQENNCAVLRPTSGGVIKNQDFYFYSRFVNEFYYLIGSTLLSSDTVKIVVR